MALSLQPTVTPEVKTDKKPLNNAEYLGNHGYNRSITSAFSRDILDPTCGAQVEKYGWISRNPVVYAGLWKIIADTFWTPLQVSPANDYDRYPGFEPIDATIIRSMERQMASLESDSFEDALKSILHNALVYGFFIAELTWANRDGEYWLTKAKTKPSYQFDFYVNQVDDVERLFQGTSGAWIDGPDLMKFAYAPWPSTIDGNPYGRSILQPVYHDVISLEELERSRVLASQLLAVKPMIHRYSVDKGDRETIRGQLLTIGSGTVLSLQSEPNPDKPGEFAATDTFEVLEDRASPQGLQEVKEIIEQYEKRIMRAMGIPDNMGLTSTITGSYAKSFVERDMYMSRIADTQKWVSKVCNKFLVPAMVRYNFPNLPNEYTLPKMSFQSVEEEYESEKAVYASTLIRTGIVKPNSKYIKDFLGIPEEVEQDTAAGDVETEQVAGDDIAEPDVEPTNPELSLSRKVFQLDLPL